MLSSDFISVANLFSCVIALLNGVLLGNYLTTAYHRIPLNKPINGMLEKSGIKPHCSECHHALKYYEYFPVLSWFSTRFKCNYCGVKVSKMYTFLEISMMVMSLICYQYLGLGLSYLTFLLFFATVLLNAVLLISFNKLYLKSLALLLASALIFVIIQEL